MSGSFSDVTCASDRHALISSSIVRDVKLVLISFVATCVIIFVYNYRLQQKCDAISEEFKAKTKVKSKPSRTLAAPQKGLSFRQSIGLITSGDFLSAVLSQIWNHMNIAVSNSVKEMMGPILQDLPVPIHFIKLDLGDVPIKTKNMFVQRIKSKGQRPQEIIQIDFDLEWDGECDILLQATISKSVKLTFGVQHIKLKGRFSLILGPLTTDLPVVSAVQYGFTNPPGISLSYAGCVKSLSDKLAFVDGALKSAIDSTLAGMLVLPYRMGMPIDLGTYDYLETYRPPEGMLRIGVTQGRGFRILKKLIVNDIPDIYAVISLGASKPFRNTTKYDSLNPQWEGETQDFILYDWDQKIYVSVFDEDKGPMDPDDLLGKCEITAKDLFENDGRAELALVMNGEETGAFITLSAECYYLSKQTTSLSLPEFNGKHKLCGLLTIIITKAFDIPLPKEDCATMVKVVYGKGCSHEETFWTGTVADYPGVDAVNPFFDMAFHVPITSDMLDTDCDTAAAAPAMQLSQAGPNETSPKCSSPSNRNKKSLRNSLVHMIKTDRKDFNFVEMTLIDGDSPNGTKGHGDLGTISISRRDLIDARNHTITETRAIGDDGAKLEFKVMLSGVQSEEESDASDIDEQQMDIILDSMNGEAKESRTVMLTALRGRGFPIHKRGGLKKDDVPDVYLSIPQLNWKTSVVKDDTMPQWNESKVITVSNMSRKIRVDAYDKNSKSKDEYIGTARFPLEQLLRSRIMELELMNGSEPTRSYVTMQCIPRTTQEEETNADVLSPLLSASAPASFSPFNLDLDNGVNGDDQSITNQTIDSNLSMSSSRRRLFRKSSSLPTPKSIAMSVSAFKRGKSKRNKLRESITEESIQEA